MRKKLLPLATFLTIAALFAHSQNNARLFDQLMQLKNVAITVQADEFIATTFLEIEFYNPSDKEIEGLYRFRLNPGQAITAFQLELNGKFRDGSIEERWKARSSYGSIVGKRMDPALLQFDYDNNYRLNIFPVPAKGSRKITMTIQQLLSEEKDELIYRFPLYGRDTASHFEITVRVNNSETTPIIKSGLLAGRFFSRSLKESLLTWKIDRLPLSGEISFALAVHPQNILCVRSTNQKNYYALRPAGAIQKEFNIHPNKLAVCWDVSASAIRRNLKKEINFLKQYISYYSISQLTIIPFNSSRRDSIVFRLGDHSTDRWEKYLQSLIYDGATQFGCLDLSSFDADAIFLFSDGKNSYGVDMPYTGKSLVYSINSAMGGDIEHLSEIAGSNGGKCIDLNRLTISDAIIQAGRVQNWLLQLTSTTGKIACDQFLPIRSDKNILLTGIFSDPRDTLILYYGHGKEITNTERIYLSENNCPDSTVERINMLQKVSAIQDWYSWSDILEFGLKEKIVTPNTSFIVLEKVEDYIKYNIAPPKDLEDECMKLNYVKMDTRSQRQRLKQQDEFDILSSVAHSYNDKIKQWDSNTDTIQFSRVHQNLVKNILQDQFTDGNHPVEVTGNVSGVIFGSSRTSLSEVVVTGYGTAAKNNLTASVRYVNASQIRPGLTIEGNLQGRVAGVSIQSSGNPFITPSSITIRGISSLATSGPLYIIDEIPVHDNPNNYINVNDIESITVLKDAAAAAIYGGLGGNGVIIINSKKGRNSHYSYGHPVYRLKDTEDVDYLQELKQASQSQLVFRYSKLRVDHGDEPGFYLDVAQYFFEKGLKQDAMQVLQNAAEASDGSISVLKAICYILESWKDFGEAIRVYEQLLLSNPYNLYLYRDLAWAYYQNGNYQKAVDILYEAIKLNLIEQEARYTGLKTILLDEMNAVISAQCNKINISMIPSALIKELPVDLKITVEGNNDDGCDLSIIEPGGSRCSSEKPLSKHKGYMNRSSSYYYYSPVEYQIRKAVKGTYRVRVNYYDYRSGGPSMIRIMTFKNFGREDQTVDIENVMMDNQYGNIEIGQVKWGD